MSTPILKIHALDNLRHVSTRIRCKNIVQANIPKKQSSVATLISHKLKLIIIDRKGHNVLTKAKSLPQGYYKSKHI